MIKLLIVLRDTQQGHWYMVEKNYGKEFVHPYIDDLAISDICVFIGYPAVFAVRQILGERGFAHKA